MYADFFGYTVRKRREGEGKFYESNGHLVSRNFADCGKIRSSTRFVCFLKLFISEFLPWVNFDQTDIQLQ